MALGQAAGVAAHLAIAAGTEPRGVDIDRLQRAILERNQVITFFRDIDSKDPHYAALQYFGTKGFFSDYQARSKDPVDPETARRWWRIATKSEPPSGPVEQWFSKPVRTRGELCGALYRRIGER